MGEITGYFWLAIQFGGVIVVGVITALIKDWVIATFAKANSRRKQKLIDGLERKLLRLARRTVFNDLQIPLIISGFRFVYSLVLFVGVGLLLFSLLDMLKSGLAEGVIAWWFLRAMILIGFIILLFSSYIQTRVIIMFSEDSKNATDPIGEIRRLTEGLQKLDADVDTSSMTALANRLERERREAAALAGFEVKKGPSSLPRLLKAGGA